MPASLKNIPGLCKGMKECAKDVIFSEHDVEILTDKLALSGCRSICNKKKPKYILKLKNLLSYSCA